MHDAAVATALSASIASVLEQMFFVTDLTEIPAAAPDTTALRTARVRFSGDQEGWVDVAADAGAASAMAADFLALDPGDLSASQIDDVVLELANMLCGAALSRLENDALIHLSAPAMLPSGPLDLCEPVTARTVDIGTGRVTVRVHFDTPCPTSKRHEF